MPQEPAWFLCSALLLGDHCLLSQSCHAHLVEDNEWKNFVPSAPRHRIPTGHREGDTFLEHHQLHAHTYGKGDQELSLIRTSHIKCVGELVLNHL